MGIRFLTHQQASALYGTDNEGKDFDYNRQTCGIWFNRPTDVDMGKIWWFDYYAFQYSGGGVVEIEFSDSNSIADIVEAVKSWLSANKESVFFKGLWKFEEKIQELEEDIKDALDNEAYFEESKAAIGSFAAAKYEEECKRLVGEELWDVLLGIESSGKGKDLLPEFTVVDAHKTNYERSGYGVEKTEVEHISTSYYIGSKKVQAFKINKNWGSNSANPISENFKYMKKKYLEGTMMELKTPSTLPFGFKNGKDILQNCSLMIGRTEKREYKDFTVGGEYRGIFFVISK